MNFLFSFCLACILLTPYNQGDKHRLLFHSRCTNLASHQECTTATNHANVYASQDRGARVEEAKSALIPYPNTITKSYGLDLEEKERHNYDNKIIGCDLTCTIQIYDVNNPLVQLNAKCSFK